MNTNEASDSVNILAALQYLQSIGEVSSNATIEQIDFGWEICNTAGQSLNFSLNNYELTESF